MAITHHASRIYYFFTRTPAGVTYNQAQFRVASLSILHYNPGKFFQEDPTDTQIKANYHQIPEEHISAKAFLREISETLLLTILIFWAVNAATGRFRIDGSSMEPNLHNGQYIIINKLMYQLREPERGDIVVFQYPHDPSRDFIKRVIGLPGDEIKIERGSVRINGQSVSEPYIVQLGAYSGTWELNPGEYFVLGDNRNNSSDSHNWGILPGKNLIGKAWVVYWPIQDWGAVPHVSLDPGDGSAHAAGG